MTCQEYRAALLISPLPELMTVESHAHGCDECGRLASAVLLPMRDLKEELARTTSALDSVELAAFAMSAPAPGRHWRVVWQVAALVLITVIGVIATADGAAGIRAALGFGPPQRVDTIVLRCLSPAEAVRLAAPYFRSSGSAVVPGKRESHAITLRGTQDEVVAATIMLAQVDGTFDPAHPVECPVRP